MQNNRKVCPFFLKNKCKYGKNCRDYHPEDINMNPPASQQSHPNQAHQKSSTCHFFLTNSCTKKNNCEFLHGYCDRLKYIKTIENHKNQINCLVNMDDTKYISSDSESFYIRFSGNDEFFGKNIASDFKIGKLIYSSQKVIFGIEKNGL
jgi:hypothetical protein